MSYKLIYKKTADRDLSRIRKRDKQRIITKLEWFSQHPSRSRNVKYIEKYGCLRYRVGKFRVFFEKDDENKVIQVLSIDKRSTAYR